MTPPPTTVNVPVKLEYLSPPADLRYAVGELRYSEGWEFWLEEFPDGWFFMVRIKSHDSYHPERGRTYQVTHRFAVPPMRDWTREAWEWWILDQLFLVGRHEICEGISFVTPEGERRPFEPPHELGSYYYAITRHEG